MVIGSRVVDLFSIEADQRPIDSSCATLSAVTRSRVWAVWMRAPAVWLNISSRPTIRARRRVFAIVMIRRGGRTGRGCWGRCARVTHSSGRTLPYAVPPPGWGTTGSATRTGCRGSGSELRFSWGGCRLLVNCSMAGGGCPPGDSEEVTDLHGVWGRVVLLEDRAGDLVGGLALQDALDSQLGCPLVLTLQGVGTAANHVAVPQDQIHLGQDGVHVGGDLPALVDLHGVGEGVGHRSGVVWLTCSV